jgi:hypothetical protein
MDLEWNFFSTTTPSWKDRIPRGAGSKSLEKARDAVSWRFAANARRNSWVLVGHLLGGREGLFPSSR